MPYQLTTVQSKAELQAALENTADGAFVSIASIGGTVILITRVVAPNTSPIQPAPVVTMQPASATLSEPQPSTVKGSLI